jgi:hypothetical protein
MSVNCESYACGRCHNVREHTPSVSCLSLLQRLRPSCARGCDCAGQRLTAAAAAACATLGEVAPAQNTGKEPVPCQPQPSLKNALIRIFARGWCGHQGQTFPVGHWRPSASHWLCTYVRPPSAQHALLRYALSVQPIRCPLIALRVLSVGVGCGGVEKSVTDRQTECAPVNTSELLSSWHDGGDADAESVHQ